MKINLETFEWESEEQRKGFMSFFQYLRKHGLDPRYDEVPGHLVAAYLIQKSHESHEWWAKAVGDHVRGLEDQIVLLRAELNDLKK